MDEPRPAVLLAEQLRFPRGGQPVILRALVGLAQAPFRVQPAALHETVQRGIEGTDFDSQQIVRLGADGLANTVAGPLLEGPKDEHVEGTSEKVEAGVVRGLDHSRRQSTS